MQHRKYCCMPFFPQAFFHFVCLLHIRCILQRKCGKLNGVKKKKKYNTVYAFAPKFSFQYIKKRHIYLLPAVGVCHHMRLFFHLPFPIEHIPLICTLPLSLSSLLLVPVLTIVHDEWMEWLWLWLWPNHKHKNHHSHRQFFSRAHRNYGMSNTFCLYVQLFNIHSKQCIWYAYLTLPIIYICYGQVVCVLLLIFFFIIHF